MKITACPEAYQALHESVALLPKLVVSMSLVGAPLQSMLFSNNGSYVLAASANGTVWRHGMAAGDLFSDPLFVGNRLQAVVFNSNGSWLASASEDGQVKVWETRTRCLIATIRHEFCQHLAFHPARPELLAIAGGNGLLAVWQIAPGGTLHRLFQQRVGKVCGIDVSPDGQVLVTAGEDGTARVWALEGGRQLAALEHAGAVNMALFHPNGQAIVTASSDGTTKLWQWHGPVQWGKKARCDATPLPHQGVVKQLAFSPQGIWLATCQEQIITVWDTEKKSVQRQWTHPASIHALAFNGRFLLIGSSDKTARLWDRRSGQERLRFVHEQAVRTVALSPNGHYAATGSDDGRANIWKTLQGDQVTRISHPSRATIAAFSSPSDQSYLLATAETDGTIQLSHFTEENVRFGARLAHPPSIKALAFCQDGGLLTSASEDQTIALWSVAEGKRVATFKSSKHARSLAFSPDGKLLAQAHEDGTVQIHRLMDGRSLASLTASAQVLALAWSPHRHLLVTGTVDGRVCVWDWKSSGEKALSSIRHRAPVNAVVVSSDETCIGTASEDGTARIWLWEQGEDHIVILPHSKPVRAVTLSPDGRYGATIESEGAVSIWEIAHGELVNYLPPERQIHALAFSPDGTHLAAACQTGETLLIEPTSRRIQAQFTHQASTNSVLFSPEGRYLMTTSNDGKACVWLWQPADLLAEASRRLDRNLSQEEWQKYMGDEPYRQTLALQSWRSQWEYLSKRER
jgi:WD40 repeat protein